MNGNNIYENNYRNKISKLIKDNKDKTYLSGFAAFINKSSSTIFDYLSYIIAFINTIGKKVEDLELDDYTGYLYQMNDKSSSYKILIYSALKKFSLYLKASGKNNRDPMQYVERPRFSESETTKNKREIGYLNTREIHKYIENIDNGAGTHRAKARQENWKSRDKAIILILLSTGMRCSALYKLNIDSINFEEQTLTTMDKGNKYRKFELSDELVKVIREWIRDREILLGDKEEDALFISNRRNRMTQYSISDVVNKYAYNINGKHITPHKLRATYGTQLYSKTGNLYMVQECMGHSNPKTTELYIRGQKNETSKTASDIMKNIIF